MNPRITADRSAHLLSGALAWAGCLLVIPLAASLAWKSLPVLKQQPLTHILLSTDWQPLQGKFGMLPFLAGTILVTLIAMMIAAPLSLMTAIFLSEYAPQRLRRLVLPLIDLLSGIPSVIYGMWGILAIVPIVQKLAEWCGAYSSGYSLLAGALVLAVMVSPFMIHVAHEVLCAVPQGIRVASLALGATRWETVQKVVLRRARPGLTAAVVLGMARGLGETIAVLMVVGNVPLVPHSPFDPAYPLPALIANNYGEMMSIPLYDSALLLAALILLAIVLVSNIAAQAVLSITHKELP